MAGDLTPEEKAAVKLLRNNIPDVLDKLDEIDSHDLHLVRWLRARNLNVSKAAAMMRADLKWREEENIDILKDTPYSEHMLEKLRVVAAGHDRNGHIVGVFHFGSWDMKTLLEEGHGAEMDTFLVAILEHASEYLKRSSLPPKTLRTNFVVVFDFQGFAFSQVLSRQVIHFLVNVLKKFEAHYPERLKGAYVVNVPKIFEIFWPLLNHVLTMHTLSKVRIYGGDSERWRKILVEDIGEWDLPSSLGGTNTTLPWYSNELRYCWYPRSPSYNESEFTTVSVAAKGKLVKDFTLEPGDRITWNFKTDYYDIGFEFLFEGNRLFPYAKTDSHLYVQDGLHHAVDRGTYSLVFDNSYSNFRGKTLHYVVCVEKYAEKQIFQPWEYRPGLGGQP